MAKKSLKSWQTISRRKIIEDVPWIKLYTECVRLPNGAEIPEFYQVRLPEYTVIVALTQQGFVIMERQYKHAIGNIILNLPSGYLNDKEAPLVCAQRELLEETGFESQNWSFLGTFWVDGNRGCGKMHSFVASDARQIQEPQNDNTEELEVVFEKPKEAVRKLLDGGIVTMGSALALSLALISPVSPLQNDEGRK